MKQKIGFVIVLCLGLFGFSTINNQDVEATGGALQKASIEKCGSKYYGKHTTHWHRAVKKESRWYATGSTLKRVKKCKYTTSKSTPKKTKKTKKVKNYKLMTVKLKKCTDGDTAKFSKIGKTRFLMIDTPEMNTKQGKKAKAYTCSQLKKAKKIQVRYDGHAKKKDRYKRSLVWVYTNGKLLQAKIAKKGYVKKYYDKNGRSTKNYKKVKLTSKYVNQVHKALKKKKGYWK